MTHVCDSTLLRLKRTTPRVIEAVRGIDAFEIDGKLWFRLIDIARALQINITTEQNISRKLLNSPHAWHWRENYVGHVNHRNTLIDVEVVEDIAIMYAFVARADVMAALPRTGEKVELPATRYNGINWDMVLTRKAKREAKRSRKPSIGGVR